jgi:nuclear-control-of-ATPase protein 2
MVLDLGRDYYKLDGPQLESLGAKVRAGDMEEVLRVYEREMQVSPQYYRVTLQQATQVIDASRAR